MKLRSTLLFAAASLAASALAPVPASAELEVLLTMSDLVSAGTIGSGVSQSSAYTSASTVYEFSGNGAITGIKSPDLVSAIEATSASNFVTIAAWVNPDDVDGLQAIFSYGGGLKGFNFNLNGDGIRFTSKGVDDMDTVGQGTIDAGEWNFVAFTFSLDGVANDRFLSGETSGSYWSNKNTPTVNAPGTKQFAIGSRACDGLDEAFSGKIANLTILTSDSVVDNLDLIDLVGSAPVIQIDTTGKLVWAGTADSNTWNTTETNWADDGTASSFTEGADVAFTESATNKTVNLEAGSTVTAGNVTVGGSGYSFVVSGDTATIAGKTLTVADGATLTVGSSKAQTVNLEFENVVLSGKITYNNGDDTWAALDFAGGELHIYDGQNPGTNLTITSATVSEDSTITAKWDKALNIGTLSGSAGLTMTGGTSGRLTVNITNLDSYTGTLTTNNGNRGLTLNLGAAGSATTTSANVAMNNGIVNIAGTTTIGGNVTQNGGELNIAGTTTIGGNVTQNGGELNIAGTTTIGGYTGTQSSNTQVNIGESASLSVVNNFILVYQYGSKQGTLNIAGDMLVGGALWIARDGVGVVNLESGGTLVANTLKFGTEQSNWTAQDPAQKSSTLNLKNGGTLIVGGGGVTTQGAMNTETLNLNGGTLGSSAASLNVALNGLTVALGAGTTSTINTSKYESGAFGTTGASISVGNVISGDGALNVSGAGTLTLSGANSYVGGTTLAGGTLVAGNASALGKGNVAVSGGILKRGISDTLTIGGTLTTSAGAILDLGSVSSTAAISVSGAVTLEESTIFNIALGGAQNVVLLASNASISGMTEDDLKRSIYVGGALLNQRATVTIADNKISLDVSDAQALDLIWAGGDNGAWKANASGWKNETTDEAFQNGDNVTFDTDAAVKSVSIGENILAGAVVVNDSYTFSFSGDSTVSASSVTVAESKTLTLSGTGTLSGKLENSGTISVGAAATVIVSSDTEALGTLSGSGRVEINASSVSVGDVFKSSDTWTGTVALENYKSNQTENIKNGLTVNNYGNAGSTVEINGFSGYFAEQGNGTIASDLILNGTVDILNGSSGKLLTISGVVSGDGTFVYSWGGNKEVHQNFLFSNDVALKELVLKNNAAFTFSGATTQIGALTYNGSGGDVTFSKPADSDSSTYEIGVIRSLSTDNFTRNLTIEKGVLVYAETFSNAWGMGTLRVDGVLDISGDLKYATGENRSTENNIITGTGTIKANRFLVGNVGTYNVQGGVRIEIGDGGIGDIQGSGILNIGEATLGVAGNWNEVARQFTLVSADKGTTIDTMGNSATLSGVLSGTGKLIKAGDGALTLSGNNTYSGGTTVSAGTLKVTKDAALGSGAVAVEEKGTLEFTYDSFARAITGTGTLAKSSGDAVEYAAGEFAGSFDVRKGSLALTSLKDSVFKDLKIAAGATFKANQNISFTTISEATGTLAGASSSTRVSVASGAFAGTLENVALVKTGDGALDLANAKFAKGGSVVVEAGTVSNLALAGGGTLQLSGAEGGTDITLSNLTIGTGTILVDRLFAGDDVQATIGGDALTVNSGAALTLVLTQLDFQTEQALFTFTSETKSAWEAAFGTLTDGKFTGGTGTLTIEGLGSNEYGVFSWGGTDSNTLYFKEDREALPFVWTRTDSEGLWAGENWNDPKVAFSAGMNAIFDETSVSEAFSFEDYTKGASVKVDSVVYAGSVIVKPGADAFVSISDAGGTLSVSKGISIESGALIFWAEDSDFYKGEFKIGADGTLILAQSTTEGTVSSLDLLTTFSGTGTLRYLTADSELTLSGNRSAFTGTLDVDAGTVVLANGGDEKFSAVAVEESATLALKNVGNAISFKDGKTLSGAGTLRVDSENADSVLSLKLGDTTDFAGSLELNKGTLSIKNSSIGAVAVKLTNDASLSFSEDGVFSNALTVDSGAIKVASGKTTTISGNISGATGTLAVKDGGAVKFTGESIALKELKIENASRLELSGASTTLETLTAQASTHLILGGNIKISGDFNRGEANPNNEKKTDITDNASVSIDGTWKFDHNAQISIGDNATVTATTLNSVWGLDTVTIGSGSSLNLGALSSYSDGATALAQTIIGKGAGKSTLNIGQITTSGADKYTLKDLSVNFGVSDEESDRAEVFAENLVLENVTLGIIEGLDGWKTLSSTKLALNGGTTTFDVGEGQTISLNGTVIEAVATATGTEGEEGYVAATSSALVKNGSGTLVLANANANKGGTTINAGTLKFTNADKGVTLGSEYTFAGGILAAGANTTLSVGAGTVFSGNVIYTNDANGKLLIAEDFSKTEGKFTAYNGAKVEIADGKTLTLSALEFSGARASTLSGDGTLALSGTVTAASTQPSTISAKTLSLTENTEFTVTTGTLNVTSETISASGKTLTKTGTGTLALNTAATYLYDGSLAIKAGTVDVGSNTLIISNGNKFELLAGNFTGNLELKEKASAILGGGTSKITGDLKVSDSAITFGGTVTGIGQLTWGDGNTVTLTDAFRAVASGLGKGTLIDMESLVDASGNAIEGGSTIAEMIPADMFLGRDVEVIYNAENTSIDFAITGTYIWNDTKFWIQDTQWGGRDDSRWDCLTKTGITNGNIYSAGKYVEFNKAGSIMLVGDATGDAAVNDQGQVTELYGSGAINTAGMTFNVADGGTFTLTSAYESGAQDAEIKVYLQGVEQEDGTFKDDGVTILAGNIVFDYGLDNRLTGGVRILGGKLTVSNEEALGDGTVQIGDATGTAAAELSFNINDITVSQNIEIGNAAAIISVGADGDGNPHTATITNAITKNANADKAILTKTGTGTLTISRESAIDALKVSQGTLALSGDADKALGTKVYEISSGATLNILNGGGADGATASMDALAINGTLNVGDKGAGTFRANTISSSGWAQINGTLAVGSATGFDVVTGTAEDGSSIKETLAGTAISVAQGASLQLNGNVSAYGTEGAALYKTGAGRLTFNGSTLGADFVHQEGTVNLQGAFKATADYTVDGAAEISVAQGATATFTGAFNVAEGGVAWISLASGTSASFADFSVATDDNTLEVSEETSKAGTVIFASDATGTVSIESANEVKLGNVGIATNVSVDADKVTANTISLLAGSSLTLSGSTATAGALWVGGNSEATLNLADGSTLSVENASNVSVLGGTGTLKVVGGTLSVTGQNYSDEDSPAIVLDDATFNFEVTGDATAFTNLSGIKTTDKGGTVAKTGTGTLVIADKSGNIAFNGKISLNEGETRLYSTVSDADLTLGGTLRLYANAELGNEIDGVNTLATSLSGAGTLKIGTGGALVANANTSFDGTIEAAGGKVYVTSETATWLEGKGSRALALSREVTQSGISTISAVGEISTYDEAVTLKAVALNGAGTLNGANNFALTVNNVTTDKDSTLTLTGAGTLGSVTSTATTETAPQVTLWVGGTSSGAAWTLNGESTILQAVNIGASAALTVANANALGSAGITNSGVLEISADGTYANDIAMSAGAGENAFAAIVATKNVDLTGSFTITNKAFFGAEEGGTLTLSESVLADTATFSATEGTVAVAVASDQTFKGKLAGAGTFEKTGAGTLTLNGNVGVIGTFKVSDGAAVFNSDTNLKAFAFADNGAGTLDVAAAATLNEANLSQFVLSGTGTTTVNGATLVGLKDAANVTVSTGKTLNVTGDISGSKIALDGATLATTGTAKQTVSGTTLSGATVTLNNKSTASVVYENSVAFSDTTKLVLNADEAGITGGVLKAAYSGSLEKTGSGKWTVTNYTYGEKAGETLKVAGDLEWQGAKLGAEAGAISLGSEATLTVNGLASGTALAGTISGGETSTLEIKNTTLELATTAETGSAWKVKISGDKTPADATVTIKNALPGSLEVTGNAIAKLALSETMTMADGQQLIIGSGATLDLASGTLAVANSGKEKLNAIDGSVKIAENATFEQDAGICWNASSRIDVAGTYKVNLADDSGWNNATLTGKGTLEIAATPSGGYDVSGNVAGFEGTVSVATGAKINLTNGASFDAASVALAENATLEVAHATGGTLQNLTGEGKVVINANPKSATIYKAVYAWGENNDNFAGTVDVKSGVLDVTAANMPANLSVGGDNLAKYSETAAAAGMLQGGFLRVNMPGAVDALGLDSKLAKNGGAIFAGGEYTASGTFGTKGNGNLYVVEKDATLKLASGADVNGSVFVACGSTLEVGADSAAGAISLYAAGDVNNKIAGDLTLNGKLVCYVTDASVNKTLVEVGGTTYIAAGNGLDKAEIEITGTTQDLSKQDFTILSGYANAVQNLDDVLSVTVAGEAVEISRDSRGNIVVVSAVNDYSAPSGLQGIYSAIRDAGTSAVWTYLKSDRANAEMMDEKLVALSPVSFGGLLEMQSGFAALENDLLRERLEQRRYERAFIGDSKNQFKPFVNILGSEREGDGNGTESANYDISHAGIVGGFDVATSRNTIFGVSLGFDFAEASIANGGGKHEGDSTRLGVYGMSMFENAYFGYGLSAGATSFETKRNSGYNGETLTGSTDGNDINASLIFGAGWTLDKEIGIDLAPYVGLDFGYAYFDAFKEEGGRQTALSVDKTDRLSLRGKLGATLSWRATGSLRLSLDAAFSHEFLDSDTDIEAAFASGDLKGRAFSSTAYLMDENTIQIGPRVDYRIDETWSVSGGYSYETDLDDTATHSANIGVRARF